MFEGTTLRLRAAASALGNVPSKTLPRLLGQRLSKPKETWFGQMFGETYNPDRGIEDYQRMVDLDAQIRAGLDLITYTLLSKDFIITPASEHILEVEEVPMQPDETQPVPEVLSKDTAEPNIITLEGTAAPTFETTSPSIQPDKPVSPLTGQPVPEPPKPTPIEPIKSPEQTLNEEVADFVEDMLGDMKTTMRRIRKDIYTAIPYGFSISEIIYRYDDAKNQIVWDDVKSIDIETLDSCFVYNEYGDVESIRQYYGGIEGYVEIPPEKCLIYSFDEEFGNKYGRSILKQVYDHWFMKRKILKWYNIFLQKLQSPTLYGKIANPADESKMMDSLDQIKEGRTNMVTNIADELGLLETGQKGEGFQSAIAYHDTMIFRRFMIGSLILGQTEASGSYAQSKTHADVLATVLDGIHEDIASLFESKIKELVDMNYNVDKYPNFSFETVTDEDVIGLLNALQPYFQYGNISGDEQWFQDLVKEAVEQFTDVNVDFKEKAPGPPTPVNIVPPIPPGGINPVGQAAPSTAQPETAKTPIANPQDVQTVKARAHDDSHLIAGVKQYMKERGILRGF